MKKCFVLATAAVAICYALTPASSNNSQPRIESEPVYVDSCTYHSESLDPSQCSDFYIFANYDTREFQIGAVIDSRRVAFRMDGRSVSPLAFMMPAAFFEGFEGSLKVRRFGESKGVEPKWELTDGHCTGDGAGNVTCAAIGGGETVVLKLKGVRS